MKKYKKIIFLLAVLVVIGLLVYFVYLPQVKASLFILTQNSVKQDQISSLEKEKSALSNLKTEAKEAEDLANILLTLVPEKKEDGYFMIEIEALANSTSVGLSDLKFSQEKKATTQSSSTEEKSTTSKVKAASDSAIKFKELTYEMTAKGAYPQIINFLKGLEKINRAITIEKADLSSAQNIVQASIKGKIYYKND